jgi:hypothetical protein
MYFLLVQDTDSARLVHMVVKLQVGGISWLAKELLASQEGLSSLELVLCWLFCMVWYVVIEIA